MTELAPVSSLLDGDHPAVLLILRQQPHHLFHVCLPLEGLHVDHQHRLLGVLVHPLVQGVHPPVQHHAQSVNRIGIQ